VLYDRKIAFSDTKRDEWDLLKSKIGTGIELPLPDSERWFHVYTDGDDLIVESARLNVRPIMIYDPIRVSFDEFEIVAPAFGKPLRNRMETVKDEGLVTVRAL